jgi:hypothetical protein
MNIVRGGPVCLDVPHHPTTEPADAGASKATAPPYPRSLEFGIGRRLVPSEKPRIGGSFDPLG